MSLGSSKKDRAIESSLAIVRRSVCPSVRLTSLISLTMVFKGTRALEEWSRRVCSGYPGVNINNVTTAFRDGLAFCAIIHRFRPELIDFASLEAVNVKQNCELAFSLADKYLGIPPLLDPEDMAECSTPDRKSILLYLSQIYQVLGNQSPEPSPRPSKLELITNSSENVNNTSAAASKIKFRKNSTDSGIDTNLSISVDSVSSSSGVSSESDLSPQLRSEPLKKQLKTDTAKIVKSEDLSSANNNNSDVSAAKLDVIPPKPVRTFAHGKVKYNNIAGSNENSTLTTNSHSLDKTNTLQVEEGGNSKEEAKTDSCKDNDSIKSESSSTSQQFESTTRVLYLQQHNTTTTASNNNNNNNGRVDNIDQNNGNSHGNVSKITNFGTKHIIAKTNGLDTAKDGHSGNKNESNTTGGVANKNDSVPPIKSTSNGLQGILKKAGQPPKSGVSILREASTRLKPGEIQITSIKKEGVGGGDKSSPSFHSALNVFTNLEKGNIVATPHSQNSDKSVKSAKKPLDTDNDCESDKESITAAVNDEKCPAPVLVTSSAATQTDFPPILKQQSHKNLQSGENNKQSSGGFEKTRKKIHNRERTRTISDMRANSIIVRAVQAEEARTKDPLVKTRSQGSLEVVEVKQNQPKTRPGADLRVRSTEVLDWVHSRQPLQPALDHLHGYGTLDSRRDIYQQHELVRPSGTYKNYYNHLASNSLIGEMATSPPSNGPILPGPPSNLSVSASFVRPVSHTESMYASYSSLFSNTRLLANQEASRHNGSIPPGHTAFQSPGGLVQPPTMSLTAASQAKRPGNPSKPETCNVTDFVRTFDTRLYVKALPNHVASSNGMQILSGGNSNQYHLPAAAPASIVTTPTSNNYALASKCPPTIHPAAQVSAYRSPVAGKLMWKTPPPASTTPLPPSTPQLIERNMSASPIGMKSVHFNGGGRSLSHDYEHSTLV